MSFIRFGEQKSDVYVYPGQYGGGATYYECCGCAEGLIRVSTKDEMHKHLLDHLSRGDCVPEKAFDDLTAFTEGETP